MCRPRGSLPRAPGVVKGTCVGSVPWVPETWDEWRKVGSALKKKGQPMGQAFGHSLGDPNNWAYSVTWGFGGAEIDQSGKVIINSKETIEAVKFTVAVW